jgi:thymidylate synthase
MRSNDVVFGYKNDWAWAQYLLDKFVEDYNFETEQSITKGNLTWQVMNLHVYARHFDLVKV